VKIELGHPLESVLDGEGDMVEIHELIRENGHGKRKNPDRLYLSIAEIDDVTAQGRLAKVLDQADDFALTESVQGVMYPAGKGQPTQTQLFRGSQHLALVSGSECHALYVYVMLSAQ